MPSESLDPSLPPAPPDPPLQAFEAEPGRVALYDADGAMQSVPTENAEAAVREYGYRPASRGEIISQNEGALGSFKAGLYGAARGASFGVFDPLAVAASRAVYGEEGADLAREELNIQQDYHPTASMAGEIGGSLLPLMVGAPAAGEAVVGESLLARAASRAVGAAPRAFAEGAAMGLGQQLSEDTLGNHDLVAQKYLMSGLKGGMFGAILGAGLHAGFGAAGDKLAVRAAEAATKGEGAAGYRTFGSRLSEIAEEQAAKGSLPAAGISASEMQKLGKTAGDQQTRFRQIGRTLLDEGVTTPGASKAVQAERLTTRVAEVGEELGSIRKSLEKSAVRPSAESAIDRIGKEIIGPLVERPFSADAQRVIRPYVEEISQRAGGKVGADGAMKVPATFDSFEKLHTIRQALDEKLSSMKAWEKLNMGAAAPGHAELRAVRGILEDEFELAAERAAVDLGEGIAQKYKVTKALYSDLKTAEKWTTKAAARESQHRAVSLTDTIAMGAGAATGHLGIGLLAPVANKMVRTYGNQVGATLADRAAKLLGVQRAAETFDARVSKAVKGFYSGEKKAAQLGAKSTQPKVDPETTRALRAAVQNPAALTERVAQVVGATGLRDDAPRIAQAMASTIMRAAAYLQGAIPPEPPPAGFSFGAQKPRPLGPQAQQKLENAVAALDIEGLLSDIEGGRVDRQKVEALRIINPQAHEAIIGALTRQGIEKAAELTHQQEVALSILTGKPIGAMMQPRTILGFQKAHAQGAPPDPTASAGVGRQSFGGGGGQSRTADSLRSGSDRMEAADE